MASSLTTLIHDCVNEVSVVLQDIRHTRLLRRSGRDSAESAAVNDAGAAGKMKTRPATGQPAKQLEAGAKTPSRWSSWGRIGQVGENRKPLTANLRRAPGPGIGEFDGIVEEILSSLESLRRSAFLTAH